MKHLSLTFFFFLAIPSFVLAGTPVEVLTKVTNIFSPKGFDSNDNTEVVVEGELPNLCHKSPKTEVTITDKTVNIKLTSLKYETTNPYCPEMVVPFVETVHIGLLDKGDYEIVVNGKSVYERKGSLSVSESTSNSVDDHVYANVEAVIKREDSKEVTLVGYNPSDCFILDEIKTLDNGKDVYSVLPKMKQVNEFCPRKMTPFSYKMVVPNTLKPEKVLLHVRSMDGRSVNSLFYNNGLPQ